MTDGERPGAGAEPATRPGCDGQRKASAQSLPEIEAARLLLDADRAGRCLSPVQRRVALALTGGLALSPSAAAVLAAAARRVLGRAP